MPVLVLTISPSAILGRELRQTLAPDDLFSSAAASLLSLAALRLYAGTSVFLPTQSGVGSDVLGFLR